MAVRSGSEEMVKCLLAHETIDINVTNREGKTAFQLAKESDMEEIMELFPISIMTTQCASSTVDIKKEQPVPSH